MIFCLLSVKGRKDYKIRKFHKGNRTSPGTREQTDWQKKENKHCEQIHGYMGYERHQIKNIQYCQEKHTFPQSCFSFCVGRTKFINFLTSLSPFTHCASGDILKVVVWPPGATSLFYLSFYSDLRWRIQELLIRSPQRPLSIWASLKLDFNSESCNNFLLSYPPPYLQLFEYYISELNPFLNLLST